jgi:hypothetical protein
MSLTAIAALLSLLPQGVTVDAAKKEVRVPCKIAPRKLPNLPEIYPCEVGATLPAPKGVKAHETVVIFEAKPSDIHKAVESLGLKAGKPGRGEVLGSGPEVQILLDLPAAGGRPAGELPLEKALVEKKTGRPLPQLKWIFTGSVPKDNAYGADVSGTLIGLFPVTDELVFQSSLTMREEGMIKLDTNKGVLPPEGTACTLIIRPGAAPAAAAAAAPADPEREVLKFSRNVGPAALPPPTAGVSTVTTSGSSTDPFEHRKEIRTGKSLPDSSKPVDAPAPK